MSGGIDDRRRMLQHVLATLAYRTQKALRGSPASFPDFRASVGVRTPHELVRHMTSVLEFARTSFGGAWVETPPGRNFTDELHAFHETLEDLRHHLDAGTSFGTMRPEEMLQGPFADAMTHAGQLALLRRLAGSPVPPEDFSEAGIDAANVGPAQPLPARPHTVWLPAELAGRPGPSDERPRVETVALLVIDVQKAIDHPSWGRRNNPEAEGNMGRLLAAWRRARWPIFHVRHLSREPNSTYRPGQEGCEFKDVVRPEAGEPVVDKHTNSAFIGTGLEARLRSVGVDTVVITGVITNNSVEATARMSGNLGFVTLVVKDATATFDRHDYDGVPRTAEEVHAMSLANLEGEYAQIVGTDELLEERRFRR